MAFSSAEVADVRRITKQSQFAHKPIYFINLDDLCEAKKGRRSEAGEPNGYPLVRQFCALPGPWPWLLQDFADCGDGLLAAFAVDVVVSDHPSPTLVKADGEDPVFLETGAKLIAAHSSPGNIEDDDVGFDFCRIDLNIGYLGQRLGQTAGIRVIRRQVLG